MTDPQPDPPLCLAIPFYPRLHYLGLALRSLIDQTDSSWTAIVVDDASPEEGAGALVAGLGDPRIRCVRNASHRGVAANSNRCVELASSEARLAVVFHADHEPDPRYVATV